MRDLLIQHAGYTGSRVAARLLERLGIGPSASSSRSCRSIIAAFSNEQKEERPAESTWNPSDHDRLVPVEVGHG